MAGPGEKEGSTRSFLELIADPLRLSVIRCLEERERASLPELAEAAGVHPNTLRPHVLELEQAGALVSERRSLASGRGRPAIDYRLAPEARSVSTDFLGVAELLAAAVDRAALSDEQLRAVGDEWGRYLVGRPGSYEVESVLPRVLRALGYEADVEETRLKLARCPCSTIAPGRPELMCMLAEGVVRGTLSAAGTGRTAREFEHDPQRRCCIAKLTPAN